MIKQLCLATMVQFVLAAGVTFAADPYADRVIDYVPGSGIGNDFVTGDPFSDPTASLGQPTRFTSDPANFGGATTPFQSPFRADEVVTIGEGGLLEVAFDQPVVDDPLNPYGIDLLIFGNSFLGLDFGAGTATGGVFSEGGVVEVSANGIDYTVVPGVDADGKFPTLGYLDLTEAFPSDRGQTPSNFTLPVDPAFDVTGLTPTEVYAGYNGSGGGLGIDIGALNFSEISYVRITNPLGSGVLPEIDGFADVLGVPEPTALMLTCFAAIGFLGRHRGHRA